MGKEEDGMCGRGKHKRRKGRKLGSGQNSCCHFSRLRPQARLGYSCCGRLCSASNEDLTAGQTASAAPPPHAQGLRPVRHAPGPGPQGPSAQGWRLLLPGPRPPGGLRKGVGSPRHHGLLLSLIGSNDLRDPLECKLNSTICRFFCLPRFRNGSLHGASSSASCCPLGVAHALGSRSNGPAGKTHA